MSKKTPCSPSCSPNCAAEPAARRVRPQRLLTGGALLAVCLFLLWPSATVLAATQERPDPELRALLKQAITQQHYFQDKFDAEVWMVDMAGRLSKRAPHIPADERVQILQIVHRTASEYGLNPQMVLALIEVESNFDRFALSKAGARGLMQVMPFWREEIGRKDDNLFDIATNVRYGCAILKLYLEREKKAWAPALSRYNGSYGQGWYPSRVFNAFHQRWFVREDRRAASAGTAAGSQTGTGTSRTSPARAAAVGATGTLRTAER